MTTLRRVLVIRNDKLGDFMLAWPALAMLRSNLPQTRVSVLVPSYTEPLARACPYIDDVIVDPKLPGEWRNGQALARVLRPACFDAVITLFSRFDTGLASWLAGIPLRYAPATKLAQLFYNRKVRQRRSRSEKPEWAYNADLVAALLGDMGRADPVVPPPPYLQFPAEEVQQLRRRFVQQESVSPSAKLVFIHSGHGGSANNLSLGQFAELAQCLVAKSICHFVLTAGPGEEQQARELAALLPGIRCSVHISSGGLVDFAKQLQWADVFVSGSTGPLHIAGALNCRTAAFYPRRRSASALRWQTINSEDRRLAFSPPATAAEGDMGAIDMPQTAAAIAAAFLVA